MTVRPATPAALAVLFDGYRQFYAQPADLARARAFVGERLAATDTTFLVAEAGGALVGFTHLFPSFTSVGTARLWILNDLFVAPEARRRGRGAAPGGRGARAGDRRGPPRAPDGARQPKAGEANASAQALYRRLGWTVDDGVLTFERAL